MDRTLDLDCLKTFLHIAETGSFTRAAHIVGRTQSAVSMQIQRLERALGGKLFERQAGVLHLSTRGDTLRDYARQLIGLNDEALERLRGAELSGKIRLGVSDDFAEGPLVGALTRFRARHARVSMEVTVNLSHALLDSLDDGKLDLVVAKRPHSGPDRDGVVLSKADLVWACGIDAVIHEDEPVPLVLFPERAFPRDTMVSALEKKRRSWRVAATCHSLAALRASVGAGFGVTALARPTLTRFLKPVAPEALLPNLPAAETALYCRGGRLKPAVHRLRKAILNLSLDP